MDDLVVWLRGVLDYDYGVMTRAAPSSAQVRVERGDLANVDAEAWEWIAYPPRVLADIEAKRAILDVYVEARAYYDEPGRSAPAGEVHGLWTAIKHIASAYRARPGYRDEWRP